MTEVLPRPGGRELHNDDAFVGIRCLQTLSHDRLGLLSYMHWVM